MTFGGVRFSVFGMQWRKPFEAHSESIINIVLHDAIAIAHNGCSYGWATQVFKCFAEQRERERISLVHSASIGL